MATSRFFDRGRLTPVGGYETVAAAGTLAGTVADIDDYQSHTIVVMGDGSANGSHTVLVQLDTAAADELFAEGKILYTKTNDDPPQQVAAAANGQFTIPADVTAEPFVWKLFLDNLVYQDDQTGLKVSVTNNGAGGAEIALVILSEDKRY